MISGVLNVNKPAGWTSFDVVGFIRRRASVKRVGHAGTLDPAATGVLPVCLGQATRLVEYLVDATKTYRATVRLGVVTDTYDADGSVVSETDASGVTRAAVEKALHGFEGEIEQGPPAYSAIKRDGVPLYKLARRGETVVVPARRVRIDRLDIISYDPPLLDLEIDCSKGFYVRSLAHDLGACLGVGGMLAALERTRVGHFHGRDAVDLETLRAALEAGTWQEYLYAPDEIVLGWQAAILGEANEARIARGQTPVFASTDAAAARCRAYSLDGSFLAVLRREDEGWRAEKVFAPAE